MRNYLNLLERVYYDGEELENRTGVSTKSVWGANLSFDLADGFPIVTTRKLSFRIAFEETMFFLRGETNTKKLEDKNIFIWKGNTTRQFLDDRGLTHLPEGNMGAGYGHQWRNFNGFEELDKDGNVLLKADGVDQISELLRGLRNDPNSRRHIVSAWNPSQLNEMALPPCHILNQYRIANGRLNSLFYMRSSDLYHGLPYNIMSYAFLNMVFAQYLGVLPGTLVYTAGDAHIYNSQLSVIKEQIKRKPLPLPALDIKKDLNHLTDILSLEYNDVELLGYRAHKPLAKVPMAT